MASVHQMSEMQSLEEARVIETTVRAAVRSVMEVVNNINTIRLVDYQRKVAEKEKENALLKAEVVKAGEELAFLRRLVALQQQGEEEGHVRTTTRIDAHQRRGSVTSTGRVPSATGTSKAVMTIQRSVGPQQSSKGRVESATGTSKAVMSIQRSVALGPQQSSKERITAAERQRLYRARRDADPRRRAEYLESRKRKRRRVHECSIRERTVLRNRWRIYKASNRASKVNTHAVLNPEWSLPQGADCATDIQYESLSLETSATVPAGDVVTGSSAPVCSLSDYSRSQTDFFEGIDFPLTKEEPSNTDTVYVKFEIKEENTSDFLENTLTDQGHNFPSCALEGENYNFTHHPPEIQFNTRSPYSSVQGDGRLPSVPRH